MTKAASTAAPPSALQKLLLVAFGLVVLVGAVALLETGLRLAGIGDPHLYEDPFVGFSRSRDLFVETEDGDGRVYRTSQEKLAFFNDQQFPAVKAEGTYRIFALGGSTTAGRPYDAEFAFPAWLQRYLDAAAPSRRFEVVNAGGISYASYRISLVMRELLEYEPDLFVVYTGHNEFLEERTYNDLIHQSPALKALRLRLNGLRSYTLARAAVRSLRREPDQLPTTLDSDVATRLDSWRGLDLYHRDNELRASVLAHFEYNLRQLAAMADDAGVDLLFITPISNLKDFSPFKSEHGPGLTAAQRDRFDRLLADVGEAGNDLTVAGACAVLAEAVEIDREHAGGQFEYGRCMLALERWQEAHDALLSAKELDVAPLRALEAQVDVIRTVAREEGRPLLDLRSMLEADSRERFGHSILGNEYLLDHVHPDIPVHSLVAERLLLWLADRGVAEISPDWSDQQRQRIFTDATTSMDDRYYATRDLNLAKVLGWAGKLEEAEEPLRRAAAVLTDEPEVFLNLGIVLQRTGRIDEAADALRRSLELDPGSPEALFNLGVVNGAQGRFADAVASLEKALELRPDYPEALFNLGIVQAGLGRWSESLEALTRARDLRPQAAEIHRNIALAYRNLARFDDAIEALDAALAISEDDVDSWTERGVTLARAGRFEEAVSALEQALTIDPDHAEAHYNLGVIYAGSDRLQQAADAYSEAIRSDPDHLQSHNNLGILMARGGRAAEAEDLLLRAIEIAPDYADAYFNLGVVYDSQGLPDRAIAAIEAALALDPDNGRYRQALAMLLASRQEREPARNDIDQSRGGTDSGPGR